MGTFPFLGLLLLLGFHVTYSTQCDCNSSCSTYTSPVQCVRCCTHYVKRSMPLHPAHHVRRKFLLESLLDTSENTKKNRKIRTPIWREKEDQEDPVESTLPRFIRLLLKNPL